MSFLEEAKQVLSKKGAPPPPASGEEAGLTSGDEMLNAMPTGASPINGEVKVVESAKPLPASEEKPSAPIKIAGKEFSSIDEAIKYAEQLELAQIEEKAFQEGYQKANEASKPAEPAAKTYVEEAEEVLFEDPKKAIEILRKGIQDDIWGAYNKMTKEQQEVAKQQASREATWNDFYKSNTDLGESREYVDFLLQKNWNTLKDMQADKALEQLADMARKGLRINKEAALPAKELQNKPAIMAGAGAGATSSSSDATPEKPMDFIAQLAKLRKRK
jgi:hypothetical protein